MPVECICVKTQEKIGFPQSIQCSESIIEDWFSRVCWNLNLRYENRWNRFWLYQTALLKSISAKNKRYRSVNYLKKNTTRVPFLRKKNRFLNVSLKICISDYTNDIPQLINPVWLFQDDLVTSFVSDMESCVQLNKLNDRRCGSFPKLTSLLSNNMCWKFIASF